MDEERITTSSRGSEKSAYAKKLVYLDDWSRLMNTLLRNSYKP